ncbi:hypothetical protein PPTG_07388 [Phytophthora nicotianae INRA-310]|uniref:Uncharacterized protein n=1 Tax=Phytophthora nicotianae (strain INRA-310) TaxID=761204 RepID=W2QSI0_PHYN3|nr:hypothetical protein PPTG_07388 [Phytophthora nicotianae INRA-310]ETN15225.1 hypothetical protein PPTG_07388 [Phytophthora nicotianae INRA-310]
MDQLQVGEDTESDADMIVIEDGDDIPIYTVSQLEDKATPVVDGWITSLTRVEMMTVSLTLHREGGSAQPGQEYGLALAEVGSRWILTRHTLSDQDHQDYQDLESMCQDLGYMCHYRDRSANTQPLDEDYVADQPRQGQLDDEDQEGRTGT